MASTSCFLHHHAALSSPTRSLSSQGQVSIPNNKPFIVRAHKQNQQDDQEAASTLSRRLALTVLIGGAAIATKVSPADAAYGEAANVFGKPKTNTDFKPYSGNGFKILIPSKWNPSKEKEFPGTVLRFEDNFDATSNVSVIVNPIDKKSITDYGSPEQFLSQGGFTEDSVATANILETATPVVDGKQYYFVSVLTRTADGDEGGKHQLISATVSDGKLYICKAQAGDKRWFKGAKKFVEDTASSFSVA